MTEREALKLALEALETAIHPWEKEAAITAIREALAQPEQDDERIAALRTLDYCHGLKAGWNFCAADDDAGFERAIAGTSEAVRILKGKPPQPEQSQVEETLRYEIDALETKLAECRAQQPEPVIDKSAAVRIATALGWEPKRTWVWLTDEDIDIAFDDTQEGGGFWEFARAIEAKLKEKNS